MTSMLCRSHLLRSVHQACRGYIVQGKLHWTRKLSRVSDRFHISDEVRTALSQGQAVVALESTIITHGMSYPDNIRTAWAVEQAVRRAGAVPATIALLRGHIQVGLEHDELHFLGSQEAAAVKVSRRDLAYVISQGLSGGTTVSSTMLVAHAVGIPVFVTGGIGGVHKGAHLTMDISADLTELGRTPVAVVSAGVKSILDIPKTLEYLETQGVAVASYGPSREFPAFLSATGGSRAPYSVDSPLAAARLIATSLDLGLQSGILIAVPIPSEDSLDPDLVERMTQQAMSEARDLGVEGKDTTPFLLKRVNDLMEGKSLTANIALMKHNAAVGGQIAVELATIKRHNKTDQGRGESARSRSSSHRANHVRDLHTGPSWSSHRVNSVRDVHTGARAGRSKTVVIGGTIVDFTASPRDDHLVTNGATYLGSVLQSFGGVGRNIADGLRRLGVPITFLSAVGADVYGRSLAQECPHMTNGATYLGSVLQSFGGVGRNIADCRTGGGGSLAQECPHMDLSAVRVCDDHKTATCCCLLDQDGQYLLGIGDFDVHSQIDVQYVTRYRQQIQDAPLVVIDGNVPAVTMEHVCEIAAENKVPVFFEPTDLTLANKIFVTSAWKHLTYTSPNLNELRVLRAGVKGVLAKGGANITSSGVGSLSQREALEEAVELAKDVCDVIPNVLVTLGQYGCLLCRNTDASDTALPLAGHHMECSKTMSALYLPVAPSDDRLVSDSGAGDCLLSAFICGMLQRLRPEACLALGLRAARLSLASYRAVPDTLTLRALENTLGQRTPHPPAHTWTMLRQQSERFTWRP